MACFWGACGPSTDLAADADTFAPDADPLAPDANPLAPDAAPPGPATMYCVDTCQTAADCTAATTTPITDADNYACDAQRCRYTGCNSTAECTQTYMNPNYVCGTVSGNPTPACYEVCSVPADCVIAGTTLYDADNWDCEAGKCRWAGCNSTAECTATFQDPDYTCAPAAGLGFDTCWPTCTTAADCAGPSSLFGADNYECQAGRCQWIGCHTTGECTDSNMSPSWVCE